MNFLLDNVSWIFSGIGVAIVGWLLVLFKNKSEKNAVDNQITITNSLYSGPINSVNKLDDDYLRLHTSILFVEDQTIEVVGILKDQGWRNTKLVKDIKDLSDPKVRQAHIIFVDINGVGTKLFPEKQGMGLANALKKKYPDKKIVIYSAQRTGDRFEDELQNVDYRLPKDAEPYRYVNLIEKYAKELNEKGYLR